MKFSLLYLPAYDPSVHGSEREMYDQIMAEVDFGEREGLDRVWVAEHHAGGYGGQLPCVPIMLSALAQRTKRIGLASGGVCVPLHRPIELAEQLAMVDVLSNGRLAVGCAHAFLPYEFEAYNIGMDESRERFRENIEVMRGLWSNERFSYDGKYSQLDNVELTPKPMQKPHPRLSIATIMTRESFEYAGHNGFDLMVVPYINSLEDVAERIGWYHAALRGSGYDPADFNVMGTFHSYCHEDDAVAYETMREPMYEYMRNVRDSARKGVFGKGYESYAKLSDGVQKLMDNYDLMYEERTLFGTPEKLLARIADAKAAGLTEISFITLMPSLSAEQSMRSLRLLNERVVAVFNDTVDAA
ncbi:MAG: LLM class flavin-dependent oxidoreductase [Gammaproteobacteria bacterium]|jgi:natural product biosynthesis luciferase-like monooxygenase protein|nr:LLM class flavin-dependent oxidoreductase [Gammaproteobacteria bacterium]